MPTTLDQILARTVRRAATSTEGHDRADWSAYEDAAFRLKELGYSWVRAYDVIQKDVVEAGLRLPGTLQQFQNAMSKRWHRRRKG